MSPSDLVELAEAKELMKDHHYSQALQQLIPLLSKYPSDLELHSLIGVCHAKDNENKPKPVSEVIKNNPNSTGTIKLTKSVPLLTKWEYCELEVAIGGPISGVRGTLVTFKSNGSHKEGTGNYGEIFAWLGEEGWELITSSARIDTGIVGKHRINYIFKRQIAK